MSQRFLTGCKNLSGKLISGIDRDIVKLSLPAIVSNITVPLLGLCDTAISGHLGSELFLAAIAVGTVMLNVVFWMLGFLRGGTTGLTAIAFGSGSDIEVVKVLYRALFIALTAGILLICLQNPLFRFLSLVAAPGDDIIEPVRSYFDIRIWGSPALLATMVISGWFVGMQTTVYPMIIAIGMNIVNIIVSFILVFPAQMGFNGVAAGTLISNWGGLLIAIACLIIFRKGKPLKCKLNQLMHGGLWRYFSVNGNLFLRSFFIICVTMGITAAGSRLGSRVLAINVIIMQFFFFFSFFMDGFAFSGEALVGRRLGERSFNIMSKTVNRLLKWTLATTLLFTIIYLCFCGPITSLLTDNKDIQTGVEGMTLFVVLIPVISCWAFIYDGFYVGIADTRQMMISTLIGALAFFAITYLDYTPQGIIFSTRNNYMIWAGFLSYLLLRGLYLALRWKPTINRIQTV